MKNKISYSRNDYLDIDSVENQKPNFKIIVLAIALLLLGTAGFIYKDFSAQRILYLRADDISESGLEHQDYQINHCKVSQRFQKVGDYSVILAFADKAEVISERKITNQLDFIPCDEFKNSNSHIGKLSGTSILNLFRLANKVVNGYRAKGIDYPVVFTVTLDAAEPVPGQPPFNERSFEEVKKVATELTANNGQIVIIGPSSTEFKGQTTLQEKLKELEQYVNLKVCPYQNVKSCTEEAIQKTRQ